MAWRPFRNAGLKVAALALGTLLWFTVTSDEVERLVEVPIAIRNLPAGLEITQQPQAVEVRVRGSAAELGGLQAGQLSVVADLSDTGPGETVVLLVPSDVRAPLGVTVEQLEPSTVTFKVEKSAQADVPVRPNVVGQPAPGYVFLEALVEPRTVTVVGPASRLRSTTYATTERVSIEGLTTNFVQVVAVGVGDALVRLREARTVRVTIRIEPASAERTIGGRTIAFRNVLAGRQPLVEPSTVAVTVQGRAVTLSDLPESAVNPWVDLSGVGPGLHELPVNVDLPLGFTLVSVRPGTVSVRVR